MTTFSSVKFISTSEFLAQKESSIVVDIRSENDFDDFSIGGLNKPIAFFFENWQDLLSFRDKPIIIVCYDATQSTIVGHYLSKRDFKNVSVLIDGIEGYLRDS